MHSKPIRLFAIAATVVYMASTILYPISVHAEEIDYIAQAEARKSLAITSNEVENWPDGPAIGAESAILIEANTGTILYSKNIHEKNYPASTTKILTCLLAAENSSMDEAVTFSHDAVFGIERDSSNMGMDEGEVITMEQCLYGILVGSANEAASAVAEHIAGSTEAFADMMNTKAKELGCKDSHFVNANGLYDENHYTSAYDLATIGIDFFKNELLCKMSSTATYEISPTATQPDDIVVHSKNKLLPDREYTYDYLIGSKTGYTSEARQTLVSCAEKDGMRLVCVIMKEESPDQFADTVALFDYGFSNFQKVNISENETEYNIKNTDFFESNNDIFGSSKPILSLNTDDYIVLPTTAVFDDTESSLSYDTDGDTTVCRIAYTYNGVNVGSASVDLATDTSNDFDFEELVVEEPSSEEVISENENVIFVNVKKVIFGIIVIAAFFILLFIIKACISNYNFSKRRRSKLHRKKKRPKSEFDDFDF